MEGRKQSFYGYGSLPLKKKIFVQKYIRNKYSRDLIPKNAIFCGFRGSDLTLNIAAMIFGNNCKGL